MHGIDDVRVAILEEEADQEARSVRDDADNEQEADEEYKRAAPCWARECEHIGGDFSLALNAIATGRYVVSVIGGFAAGRS